MNYSLVRWVLLVSPILQTRKRAHTDDVTIITKESMKNLGSGYRCVWLQVILKPVVLRAGWPLKPSGERQLPNALALPTHHSLSSTV